LSGAARVWRMLPRSALSFGLQALEPFLPVWFIIQGNIERLAYERAKRMNSCTVYIACKSGCPVGLDRR
jgi:hypothetical protein